MRHRAVREVMTVTVATADPDTAFKDLAQLMAEHRVSALPVVAGDGRILGVVAETDLLRKEEYADDPTARPPPHSHRARVRAAGLTARELMTAPAVTISPDASIVAAARLLDRHHIGHLVVTGADGTLAGIISPRDLLKVYLRTDDEIRAEVVSEVITRYLGCDPDRVEVTVSDGVVRLYGEVEHKSMVPLAAAMTRAVDGVVDVAADLSYAVDDSHLPLASDLDAP